MFCIFNNKLLSVWQLPDNSISWDLFKFSPNGFTFNYYHDMYFFLFWPKKIFRRFYEFLKNIGLAQKNIVKSRNWL
jgi:hypothetical protein